MLSKTDQPQRVPRKKRAPRIDTGHKIVIRLSPPEKAQLQQKAGDIGISAFVRTRLFKGGARPRDRLREIAALHVLGRRVQKLMEHPEADSLQIADTLGVICAAIEGLGHDIPEADILDAPVP